MIVKTDEKNYQDIANAIRSKLGTDATYLPSEMASAIKEIFSGLDMSKIGYANDDSEVRNSLEYYYAEMKSYYQNWDPNSTSAKNLFNGKKNWSMIPNVDVGNVKDFTSAFSSLSAIKYFPKLNFSSATNFSSAFADTFIPKDMEFGKTPKLVTSNRMFQRATFGSPSNTPLVDLSNATAINHMYYGSNIVICPQLDTRNAKDANQMFNGCTSLVEIPFLDFSKVNEAVVFLASCKKLTTLGGFANLKIGLDLSPCTLLTHESLMNVINNLYDLASNGLATQTLTLGADNLAKLTDEEKAIASDKGWTLA